MSEYTYKGIAFPTIDGSDGIFQSETDVDLIGSSIKTIILTQKGSRVMQPDFGTNIPSFIFGQGSSENASAIKSEIIEAVTIYEPRATLNNVDVTATEDFNGGTLFVTVEYSYADQSGTITAEIGS